MPVLEALLLHKERQEAQIAYGAQLLWQLQAQLGALIGADPGAVPDYFTLFPLPEEAASAQRIRDDVLRALRRAESGSDKEGSSWQTQA